MKKAAAMLLALTMVCSLAACGGNAKEETTAAGSGTTAAAKETTAAGTATTAAETEAEAAAPQEKVSIEFWHSMSGTNGERFDTMIEAFNNSQDEVEVIGTYQGGYADSIAKAINSISVGQAPDVILSGSGQVSLLTAEDGIVENLIPYMTPESGVVLDDFYEGFLSNYISDDKTVLNALPFGVSVPVLYVNTDLLAAAGQEVPTTWEEVRDVSAALVDGGHCSYGIVMPRNNWYYWMMVPNFSGTEIFSEDGPLELICHDAMIETYTFLQDMAKKNYFYYGPATDGATICQQMFFNQECAFLVESIGSLGSIEKGASEGGWNVSVERMPGGAQSVFPSGGNAMVMLASSEHKDAAWKFLQWLYTDSQGLAWFDTQAGYVACSESMKNTESIQNKMAETDNYRKVHDYLDGVHDNHMFRNANDKIEEQVSAFLDAVFYDQEDVTEQADIFLEDVTEILNDLE